METVSRIVMRLNEAQTRNNPDTDGDQLKDGEEVITYLTDPLKPDTDSDGLSDGEEVVTHENKSDPA